MRAPVPPPFKATFYGPDGPYDVSFEPVDKWDGRVTTKIDGAEMVWSVDNVEKEGQRVELGGMTYGTEEIWGDVFWFQIICDPGPTSIRYWGDRVIWREDPATDLPER